MGEMPRVIAPLEGPNAVLEHDLGVGRPVVESRTAPRI
jgi:hypothetical protein